MRLHEPAACGGRAAGPARHLMQKLERAFARARVCAMSKAQIAVHDADESEIGEVMALGHDLRADDDIDLMRFDLVDDGPHFRETGNEIGGQEREAGLREAFGDFFRHALYARAASDHTVGRAALGALLGKRNREAAVMAIQALLEAVLDEPRGALGAFAAVPARAAQRQRGIAAPVEKQQRLLAFFQRLGHGLDEARGEPPAFVGLLALEVDRRDVGHIGAGVAALENGMTIAARQCVDVAFDRGRGGGEHDRELAEIGAHHAHIARLIVYAVILLVALVVLFIDDDQAQFRVWQKQCRPRAHDAAYLAERDTLPDSAALDGREGRVPLDGLGAEAAFEAVEELARQRDFRQHDEGLMALLQRARHGLEIDLCLARARHAVEQRHREAITIDGGLQSGDGDRLVPIERHLHMRGIGPGKRTFRNCDIDEVAGLHQAVDDGRRAESQLGEFRFGADQPVGGKLQRAGTCLAHAGGGRRPFGQPHAEPRLFRFEGSLRAHHHARNHAERRQRVLGNPFRKAQADFRQRRHIESRYDGLELFGLCRLLGSQRAVPNDADARLRPERHQHEHAGAENHALQRAVIVGLVQRHGHEHGHEAARGRAVAGFQIVEQAFHVCVHKRLKRILEVPHPSRGDGAKRGPV